MATSNRQTFIGGSDIAAVLGLSQWASPVDCYFEKIGESRTIDQNQERIFRRGKKFEPIIIDMLIDELGVKVTKRSTEIADQNRYVDPEYSFLSAEIDFEWEVTEDMLARFPQIDQSLIGTTQNGDAKSCHPFVAYKFGEYGTDAIPIEYHCQAQHGLMVTGRDLTLFAVLVGTDNLCVYIVTADQETIAGMRQKAVAFWTDHVLAKVPPPPIVLDDIYRLMRRDADIVAEAPEDVVKLIDKFNQAKQLAKSYSDGADELKFQIGAWLLGADAMTMPTRKPKHVITAAGAPLLTIAYQEQTRIDSERLRTKHPEIAAECGKTSKFFRFDSPRKGKQR